jgi:hypothetical protein
MKPEIKKLLVKLDIANASPRMLRQRFRKEIRDTVMQAHADGEIELAIAEELIRAVPADDFI